MTCNRVLLWGVVLAVLATPALGAQAPPDCEQWNTEEYFQTATVEDMGVCIAAGPNPNARDEDGIMPLHAAPAYTGVTKCP